MNFLLDTCTFLWLTLGSDELSDTARQTFINPENEIYLSAISCWEISIKWSLGKLNLPVDPGQFLTKQRIQHMIEPLPLTEDATYHLSKLPQFHKDPFDRVLICQAIEHSLVILSPDPLISQYPIRTLW